MPAAKIFISHISLAVFTFLIANVEAADAGMLDGCIYLFLLFRFSTCNNYITGITILAVNMAAVIVFLFNTSSNIFGFLITNVGIAVIYILN